MSAASPPDIMHQAPPNWPGALRVYLGVIAIANLSWEAAHLPLYTIWKTGTPGEQLFAVIHCTGGDLLIALTSLALALISVGHRAWPLHAGRRVAAVTVAVGIGYTIFSEWLNIVVRKSWTYSDLMPVVPVIETGLSPLLQWLIVPLVALWLAHRAAQREGSPPPG